MARASCVTRIWLVLAGATEQRKQTHRLQTSMNRSAIGAPYATAPRALQTHGGKAGRVVGRGREERAAPALPRRRCHGIGQPWGAAAPPCVPANGARTRVFRLPPPLKSHRSTPSAVPTEPRLAAAARREEK